MEVPIPWSGGVYTITNGLYTGSTLWAQSAAAGYDIITSQFDPYSADIQTGLNNCVTVDGLNRIAADLVPATDATYSLGTSALRWSSAYVSGALFFYNGANYTQLQSLATSNRTINAPDAAGTIVLDTATQTVTNKTFGPEGVSTGQTGVMRVAELAANGTNYVGFKAPDALSGNFTWVLPTGDGSPSSALVTDGAGNLSFSTPSLPFLTICGTSAGEGLIL